MSENNVITGVLIEETTQFSYIEICQHYHIPKELMQEMIEQGLFDLKSADLEQAQLSVKDLQRMESAFRLHQDLGVNLAGVAIALDLIEELEKLRKELAILRHHF